MRERPSLPIKPSNLAAIIGHFSDPYKHWARPGNSGLRLGFSFQVSAGRLNLLLIILVAPVAGRLASLPMIGNSGQDLVYQKTNSKEGNLHLPQGLSD